MKRQLIKLTESDLHRVIESSVKKILREYSKPKTVLIYNATLEDYEAQEIADEYGVSEEEAAIKWFNGIITDEDFEEQNMPKHSKFISNMPYTKCELYKDFVTGYYFAVRNADDSSATLNTLTNPFNENVNKENTKQKEQ